MVSKEQRMTTAVRDKEFIVVAFAPQLIGELMIHFEEDFYPYSDVSWGKTDRVRDITYHQSVFTGWARPWQEAAMQYLSIKADVIDYRLRPMGLEPPEQTSSRLKAVQ